MSAEYVMERKQAQWVITLTLPELKGLAATLSTFVHVLLQVSVHQQQMRFVTSELNLFVSGACYSERSPDSAFVSRLSFFIMFSQIVIKNI